MYNTLNSFFSLEWLNEISIYFLIHHETENENHEDWMRTFRYFHDWISWTND